VLDVLLVFYKFIAAVLPYFPYNKQSKKKHARGAITVYLTLFIQAKLLANMLVVAGVDQYVIKTNKSIITLDLHSTQIQGFFNKPVDNLSGEPVIARYLIDNFPNLLTHGVIISKNAGGAKRYKISLLNCFLNRFLNRKAIVSFKSRSDCVASDSFISDYCLFFEDFY
jgi:ribose-phosphate pyrophosphokinase